MLAHGEGNGRHLVRELRELLATIEVCEVPAVGGELAVLGIRGRPLFSAA